MQNQLTVAQLIAILQALPNQNALVEMAMNQEYQQACLLYTSPSPRDRTRSRMPSSA